MRFVSFRLGFSASVGFMTEALLKNRLQFIEANSRAVYGSFWRGGSENNRFASLHKPHMLSDVFRKIVQNC